MSIHAICNPPRAVASSSSLGLFCPFYFVEFSTHQKRSIHHLASSVRSCRVLHKKWSILMYESMNPFFFHIPIVDGIAEQKKEYCYRTLIGIRRFAINGTIQNGVNWNPCMNQTRCAKRMALNNISEKGDRGWLQLVLGSWGSQQEQEFRSSRLLSGSGMEKGRWEMRECVSVGGLFMREE